ncbi:MAG: hypothetical protein AAF228_08210 [Pseudomonadota bacterium]
MSNTRFQDTRGNFNQEHQFHQDPFKNFGPSAFGHDSPQSFDENQSLAMPEPIAALSQGGFISPEEEALARTFYKDVCESGLMPRLMKNAPAPIYTKYHTTNQNNKELADHIRGIFALLDAVDDRLLATMCALILEISNNGEQRPLNIEEVGRRVMGYPTQEANLGAGGTLLRAALWMIRFGYNNPTVCTAMMHEKRMKLKMGRQKA